MTSRLLLAVVAVGLSLPWSSPISAQRLSDRSVTIIVPFTPGTGIDILARIFAEEMHKRWNQPFVVENKPGASGSIGTGIAARAVPDGHTLLMTVNGHVINAAYFKKVPYDAVKSFAPIGEVAVGNFMLTVHPKVSAKDVAEFIAYAKANPGKMNFASPGIGTTHHVSMEMFKLATGIDIMHVPYGGTSGAVRDLLSGVIDAMFLPIHVAMPFSRDNLVRVLGVGSAGRSSLAPNVQTLAEQGVAGADVNLWFALMAPAGTSDDIVKRYNVTLNEIITTPSVRDLLGKQGLVAQGSTPEALTRLIETDLARWQADLKRAGILEP